MPRRHLAATILAISLATAGQANGQQGPAAASLASLTTGELAALSQEQQDALILRAVTNGISRYSSGQERNGRPKPYAIFQDERALANLLRALFLSTDDGNAGPPPGWGPLRKTLQDAAAAEDTTPFVRVLSAHATATYEKYKKQVTPQQSDQDQQIKFRYVLAFDAYQDAYVGHKAAYETFQARPAELETATKTVQTRLLLERLTQQEPGMTSHRFEAEKARIESTMKEFIVVWNVLVKHHLDAALAPLDADGRVKPVSAVGEEKRRATIIRAINSTFDADEVARRIHQAMKAPSFAGLQPILNTYLLDEISRRLSGKR
jgi:hypothetical protein